MSELIVTTFPDRRKAEAVRKRLLELQKEYVVELGDAVVAVREESGKVKLYQNESLVGAGAISGGFWGALIGLIFLNPLFGMAIGAGAGALIGALTDVGIDDDFMKELTGKMQPGTSALFILVRRATTDKLVEEMKPFEGHILRTSLNHDDEARLRAALEGHSAVTSQS